MSAQVQKDIVSRLDIFARAPALQDENIYEDEEQLAVELAIPLPESVVRPTQPEIDPDEFERLYEWFLS